MLLSNRGPTELLGPRSIEAKILSQSQLFSKFGLIGKTVETLYSHF